MTYAIHLPPAAAVAADVAVWAGWSAAVGWVGGRWSPERVARDGPITRLRAKEARGDLYRRTGIRRWKGWLPDAGGFAGGRGPKLLGRRLDPSAWETLAGETRRAERVHWLILLALPVTLAWSGGGLADAMVAYAVVANGPCIAVQRYTRARLQALQALQAHHALRASRHHPRR